MILALDVPFKLGSVEVHVPQVARRIAGGLIAEMARVRITALSAGRDGFRSDRGPEFDGGDKVVLQDHDGVNTARILPTTIHVGRVIGFLRTIRSGSRPG